MVLQSREALMPGYSRMQGGRHLGKPCLVCMCAAAVVQQSCTRCCLEMTLHRRGIICVVEMEIAGAGLYRGGGRRQGTPHRLFSTLYFLQENGRPEA